MGPESSVRTLAERVVEDVGGAFTVGLAYLGDKLGLFAALAAHAPITSADLARRAGLDERYVREWLNAMVAAGYIEHQPEGATYAMTPEQAGVLADEGGRLFAAGAFTFALESLMLTSRLAGAFRHGGGIPFDELPAAIPGAIDRMHRPWFEHLLVQEWIAAVPELAQRLTRGARILDVGCGLGRSTMAMARAFPASAFLGIDPHAPSIQRAHEQAAQDNVRNLSFAAVPVDALEADAFDLIVAIDCVHDMADPVGALRGMRDLLALGGQLFWSEPTGSRDPLQNRNPYGRLRASLSPFHCLPVSMAGGGAALGTIIGEAGARDLARQAGFSRFDKVPIASPAQQFFLLSA
ncbi:MAG TPA: class I SAM-dependent methyltransferase [Polyangia bacterium]|nr:class I SAM-dependent methyltransferase [Polyangia bacterium]